MFRVEEKLLKIFILKTVKLPVVFDYLIYPLGKNGYLLLLSKALQFVTPCNKFNLREEPPYLIKQEIIYSEKNYRVYIFKKNNYLSQSGEGNYYQSN